MSEEADRRARQGTRRKSKAIRKALPEGRGRRRRGRAGGSLAEVPWRIGQERNLVHDNGLKKNIASRSVLPYVFGQAIIMLFRMMS